MTKKITAFLLTLSLLMAFTGCGETPEEPEVPEVPETPEVTPETEPEIPEAPEAETEQTSSADGLVGTFTMDTSSQYNNSVCHIKQMDEALVLFELDVMEGSESEDRTAEYVMSGVMLLDEEGKGGSYESDPDAEYPVTIQFDFDEDRSGLTVTAQGECGFNPDGHYTFIEDTVEVSEGLAVELIEQLPTAATSLSGNLGGYTINYPETLVSGWFYPVDAVLDDSGKTLASFLVSKDLTCVIRSDEDIEPVLIWGSTESTLNAKIMPDYFEPEEEEPEELPENMAQSYTNEEQPVVYISFDNGTAVEVGGTSTAYPELPWELPYTLELVSSDPAVVQVDGNVLTGVAEGEAVLQATLTIFGSTVTYEIPIEVFTANPMADDLPEESVGTENAVG